MRREGLTFAMKNLLYVILLLLFPFLVLGQHTFVKTIDAVHFGQNVRVFETADQGIAVFSLDSLKLYKLNSCGEPEWSKQYGIQKGNYAGDILLLKNGNFALLNRVPQGQQYSFAVTVLNGADGSLLWSKAYEDAAYNTFPYTISEDGSGNLFVCGNANHLTTNQHNNFIAKIDPNGNFHWARFYDLGPVWGGGRVGSDNSLVGRFGNVAFKTDAAGNLLWTRILASSSYYFRPVEVADGYIYTSHSNSNLVSFQKLDKQGNPVWNGRKFIDYPGSPSLLYQKTNGNFAGVFNRAVAGQNHATLIEFDKDLNIVRQNTLDNARSGLPLQGLNVGFAAENHSVLAGLVLANAAGSKLFFAKTDSLLRTGCDTTITTSIAMEVIGTSGAWVSGAVPHTFSVVNKPIPVKSISAQTTTLCSRFAPVKINIHSDSFLCANAPLALRDRSGTVLKTYHWSTGDTTATIAVTQPGKYWLRATTACGAQTVSDTVVVTRITFPKPALTPDTALCKNGEVLIDATLPGAVYRWQDGATHAIYRATKPGKYEVDVTYQTCTQRFSVNIGSYEKLLLPNIFTPNNDNRNDVFRPMEMCGVASGTLKIFNRWGQLVFETSEINAGWNGRVNGSKSADGVYFYLVEYADFNGQQKKEKGWVELVGN